ncbi:MAG TPA: S-adenosylmethionine:tRNA ribosyltransferase-isomerase [Thermoleophilaceae bacterium]
MNSALAFELPKALEAHEPPEARGLARDEVRLMVASRHDGAIAHATFRDLPEFLRAGDLLVINTSATLPAAVPARRSDGEAVELRFATAAPRLPDGRWWVVELRSPDGTRPYRGGAVGDHVTLAGNGELELVAPYAGGTRLWLAHFDPHEPLNDYLARCGHPIRYGYVPSEWPLEAYQTAFSIRPGSAEMPSAGRPFTDELVGELVARGILFAPLTLHTGVSSPERHEPPYAERYEVPEETARLVNAARAWGGRIICVGTTAVRALETVANADGTVHAGDGWTNHIVTADGGLRTVDALITGWHEPEASHLMMLEAFAGDELLAHSYDEALEHGYLWHEFGDSHLILP